MIKTNVDWSKASMFNLAYAAHQGDEKAQIELLNRLGLDPESEEAQAYLDEITKGAENETDVEADEEIDQY